MNTPYLLTTAPAPPSPLTLGYLLVEPATIEYEPSLKTLAMRPCTPRTLAHREELMPRLIDVTSLTPDEQAEVTFLWKLEAAGERPPVLCAWLDCDVSIDELAGHIAHHLVGPGAHGQPVFWRHYDPLVLSLTLTVFDAAQRAELIGPVRQWQFPWAGHHWNVGGSCAPGVSADALDDLHGWPRSDQWPRINRSEAATQVVRRLPEQSADAAARLPSVLDEIFCEADRQGVFRDANSLADYAWHCVYYGAAFAQHPKLVDAWPALARGETTWSDVLARFTSQDFEALKKSAAPR